MKESRVPLPIKRALDAEIDEEMIQQVWRGISSRRGAAPQRRIGAAMLAACLAAVAAWIVWAPDRSREVLLTVEGEKPSTFENPSTETSRSIVFEDRSALTLHPGTRIETLENDRAVVAFHFQRGRGEIHVQHGGPRRWIFECGLATVEVIGTKLSIQRTSTRLRVSVYSGLVLVRGERVPDRVRQLGAGESIEIRDEPFPQSPAAPTAPLESEGREKEDTPPTPAPPVRPRQNAPARPPPLDATEASTASALIEALIVSADDARRRGDARSAASLLEQVVAKDRGDTLSALAAFTLGRIELVELDNPSRAAKSFDRALRWPLPLDLREDALAYLVDATQRAGDTGAAREAAKRYLKEHPHGRRAEQMGRIIAEQRE